MLDVAHHETSIKFRIYLRNKAKNETRQNQSRSQKEKKQMRQGE